MASPETDCATAVRSTALRGRAFLLLVVATTGATVLALEVLGTRVIGTHYGSSLYVWAALLSITMVCLAIGYAIGGKIADCRPDARVLYGLLLAAGASVLLVPVLSGVLSPLAARLGLIWGALASAMVIFFVPLTLLATAGPFVIRLRARHVEGIGTTSGSVYAISTVGSVLGVLIVSLWMIPSLGTRGSLYVCSGVLVALGATGMLLTIGARAAPLALLVLLPVYVRAGEPRAPGEIFHTESAFGDLRVIEREDQGRGRYRMLMVNGIMQTGMPLDIDMVSAGSILRSDSYYLELLPYFHPDLAAGRRGVLIGLAGGMFARVMEFYNVDLTAVEIDVKVAEIARAYFGYRGRILMPSGREHQVELSRFPNRQFPVRAGADELERPPPAEYRGRAIIQDGRQYLVTMSGAVDFIVVDAYSSDTIPFHLITREFFEIVRSKLTDDGILAINYIGRPAGDFVTDSLFRTLADVFGADNIVAYRTQDGRDGVQVLAVYVFRKPMELTPQWAGGGWGVDPLSYELSQRRETLDFARGIVITDDLNPIDLARVQTAMEWRRRTAEALR